VGEPEQQWQQPAFDPAAAPREQFVPQPVQPSAVIVPRRVVPPPSVAETVTATVSGLVWPVMILLAIMGVVSWWPGMMLAVVASIVLGNVSGHLKSRRKALGRDVVIDEEDGGDLR
jgi:hypothetical protein